MSNAVAIMKRMEYYQKITQRNSQVKIVFWKSVMILSVFKNIYIKCAIIILA